MVRDIPRRKRRLILHRFLNEMLDIIVDRYPPPTGRKQGYLHAVALVIIRSKIMLAELQGRPFSINQLARVLRMSRSTLRDNLRLDLGDGVIMRDRDQLLVNNADNRLASRMANRVIDRMCALIVKTAEDILMLDGD